MSKQSKKIEFDIKSANDVRIQISGMYDNTLSILSSTQLNEILHAPTNDVSFSNNSDDQNSQVSGTSIKSVTPTRTKRACYKRRKNVSTITNVISTLIDDRYAWRKYGQKMILNSKHQRNYYRCSHMLEQGFQATKQVQKVNDKPSKYKITYNGFHTCNNSQSAPQIIMEDPSPADKSILINFETNTFMENHKVASCFQSMKHTPKESFPSAGPLIHEQVSSSYHYTPWDPIMGLTQVQSEPMYMMSSGLDCKDMVSSCVFSSTCYMRGYEKDEIVESYDYGDFFFELYP